MRRLSCVPSKEFKDQREEVGRLVIVRAMASELNHASHGHALQLMGMREIEGMAEICAACGKYIKAGTVDTLYGCRSCGYFLHRCCALLSQSSWPSRQQHPTHHPHALRFLCKPAYCGGAYQCNICWSIGYRFNYHCHDCNFDAHLLCALMPLKTSSHAHRHSLQLLFRPVVQGRTHCDVCLRRIDRCCYRCSSCDFDAHPGCLFKKKKKERDFGKFAKLIARKAAMHLLFDAFGGLGELMDGLIFGLEDLGDVAESLSGLEDLGDVADGLSLPHFRPKLHGGNDDVTTAEFISLLLEHMEAIVSEDAPSSS
ncbi:unnamed protein product [Victoria cruziana]